MAMIMAVTCLAACGKKDSSEKTTGANSSESSAEEITELEMWFPIFAEKPAGLERINDALNEIWMKECNAKVNLNVITWSNYSQQMNLSLAAQENIDIMTVIGNVGDVQTWYVNGYMAPLDDELAAYGQGIVEAVGMDILDGIRIDGKLYAITQNRDIGKAYGFIFRKDIFDELGFKEEEVVTLEDVGKVFAAVKEKYPEMVCCATVNYSMSYELLGMDRLGDDNGVLMNYGQDTNVVNFVETDEFYQMCKLFREWYQKGYFSESQLSSGEMNNTMTKSGNTFAQIQVTKPGTLQEYKLATGYDGVLIDTIAEPVATTNVVQTCAWAIPSYCTQKEKEAAMKVINTLYANEEVFNLITWGMEGIDYVKTEDGHITFPEGVDASNSEWNLGLGWMMGDQYKSLSWEGDDLDLFHTQLPEYNKNSVISKAFGFTFDNTGVTAQIAAVENVKSEYLTFLCWGMSDPDTTIPKFIEKMKAAGIDEIIAEKQKQLDAWLAERK